MTIEIIGAESLGVRSLCCLVTTKMRRIVIDPGVALGYFRHGLFPHPCQIVIGARVRQRIIETLSQATDVIFSHMHGDHVPLIHANPYQLSIQHLPAEFQNLSCWSLSPKNLSSPRMQQRFYDLKNLLGDNLQIAENSSQGLLSFSQPVPHGIKNSPFGSVMMSRIDMGNKIFVHASDIQLLDEETIHYIIEWQPDIVFVAGPPLYLSVLTEYQRHLAWNNALHLCKNVDVVILDHHLMRSESGLDWLDALSKQSGKQIYCAADFMNRPRWLLEARRSHLYQQTPVPKGWHDKYAAHRADPEEYFDAALL